MAGVFWYRRRKRRRSTVTQHYVEHKETARAFIHERVRVWNEAYGFEYKRIAIRNQRTCWGSCSEHGNLNFNYKLIFLPQRLADYIVVHELCHLVELNHSPRFWELVAQTLPDHQKLRRELQRVHVVGSRLNRIS